MAKVGNITFEVKTRPKGLEDHETVAEEAQRLVYGDRGVDYGHPRDDYGRTVGAFNAITGHNLSVKDGVLYMLLVKLSRMEQSPEKRDHYVDAIGYAECLARVVDIDP